MYQRIILCCVIFFSVCTSSVFGQKTNSTLPSLEERKEVYESAAKKARTPETISMETAQKLAQKLKLNEDQTRRIYEVILKTDKEISALQKSKMDTREKSLAINKANKGKLNAFEKIMTPAQFRDYRLSFP